MAALTDYAEKKLLDYVLGITTVPAMTTRYLALFTADPTDTGSLTNEVAGSGYSRVAVTSSMGETDATSGQALSASVITFGPASGSWGTITHVGLMDAVTGGNMLMHAQLDTAINIASDDPLNIAAGRLSFNLA